MIVRYTLDRKSLYNGDYDNSEVKLIEGDFSDNIKFKTHLSVIYRIIRKIKRSQNKK